MAASTVLQDRAVVDKSGNRVRRMFGQIAGKYDRMNHLLSMNVDRYWRWRSVRLVPAVGTEPILDLCTGTGDLALAYRKATGGRVPIIGADFCHEMLQIAERKKSGVPDGAALTFVEASALNLPFADDFFQIVAVAFGLRNVENTDHGLREMVRVCRPGGRVAVLEFSMPTRQPIKSAYGFYFRHILPHVGQWLARNDQDAYEYLPTSVGGFPQGHQLLARMTAAGLRATKLFPLTMGIATLYVGEK